MKTVILIFLKKNWDDFAFGFVPGSILSVNWIDYTGIANAFFIGLSGGVGGLVIKVAVEFVKRKFTNKNKALPAKEDVQNLDQ